MNKLFLTFIGLLVFAPVFGQQKSDVIDIEVETNKMVSPDVMVISIDLYYTDKLEQNAINMLNVGTEEQLKLIVKVGFQKDKIKLSQFRVSELSDYESDKRKLLGFRASQNINISIPSSEKKLIGKLIDGLSLNRKDNIKYQIDAVISDSLLVSTKNELIRKGIKEAKTKAQIISDELKIKLGTIKVVEHGRDFNDDSYSTTVKFTAPEVFDEVQEENPISDFSTNDIKVVDKIHIVWNIQ
jgi:uncharacterized protein YggE